MKSSAGSIDFWSVMSHFSSVLTSLEFIVCGHETNLVEIDAYETSKVLFSASESYRKSIDEEMAVK